MLLNPAPMQNANSGLGTRFHEGVALIVEGSSPLGREICLRLAAAGSNVILIHGENGNAAADIVNDIQTHGRIAEAHALDTHDVAAIQALAGSLVERHGSIHSLVFIGGQHEQRKISDIDAKTWA